MPKVSLRVYNREIESLISRGQTEEAIAHCKYILKQFPKHIDTYRLLGKAYLESQRYTEAADIMQRVLAVVPDDFVSQLGMGIIREDEGNMDAAIWHIERAFEIQPTNKAVQDELRRLYGRRDGSEPARIRNTRGALVRLYARGELYNQAIAESRAALAEDPRRIDLEIILARMYYLSGKKVEATEVCGRLIQRLPFCYEANRILAEILPTTSRADDARVYQQNINALDPYAAFLTAAVRTTDQVPDNAVMLERLEYIPAQAAPDQPAWAQTVGVQLDEESSETPDWLIAPPGETSAAPSLAEESSFEPIANTDETIPDWMKTAGWQPSTGAEEPVSFLSDEEEPAEGGSLDTPIAATIPDWLKEMAPPGGDASESGFTLGAVNPEEDEQLKALESLLGEASPAEETPQDSSKPAESHPELPEWFSAVAEENTTPAQDDLPAWLKPQDADLSPTDSAPFELSETSGEPDLLSAETKAAPAAETESLDDLPDWLKSDESQSLMDVFNEAPAETPPVSSMESGETEVESPAADLPNWLAPVDEVAPAQEFPVEPQELPEWLRQVETEEPAAEIEGEAPFISTLDLTQEPTAAPPASFAADGDLPEWLRESTPAADATERHEPIQDAFTPLEVPETPTIEPLSEVIPNPESLAAEDIAVNAAENENVQPAAAEDMDEAFAWLESLAARQGAEEGLLLNPEDRHSETPEWLQSAESELPPAAETASISEESLEFPQDIPVSLESPVESVEEELPAASIAEEEVPAASIAEEELPAASIVEPAASIVEPAASAAEIPAPAAADDMDSAFAWLESLAARQGAEEGLLTNPQDQPVAMPDWLQGEMEAPAAEEAVSPQPEMMESPEIPAEAESTETVPSPFIEAAPLAEVPTQEAPAEAAVPVSPLLTPDDSASVPEDLDSAFAWLENLAERQGAQEGLLLQPEDRLETPPLWIEEAAAAEEPEAEIPAPTLEDTAPIRLSTKPFAAVEESAVAQAAAMDETPEVLAEPIEEEFAQEAPLPVEEVASTESTAELTPAEEELPPLPDWLKGIEEETDSALEAASPLETPFVEAPAAPLGESFVQAEDIAAPAAEIESEAVFAAAPSEELPAEEMASAEIPEAELSQETTPATPRTAAPAVLSTLDLETAQQLLAQARGALDENQVETAVESYTQLIQSGANLDEVTQDLKTALFRYPMQIELYQALGDAYLKTDRLQEALDTFTKAEELLR